MKAKIKGIFVTGTDTEVGKTYVSQLIIRRLRSEGLKIGVMKPVATGGRFSEDARLLKDAAQVGEPLELINPICLKHPLAPFVSAKLEGQKISISKIRNAFYKIADNYEFVIVEGAGGVLVPIKKDYYIIDLIEELGLPVLLVARASLGTINHTLLSLQALRQKGIEVLCVVLNNYPYKKEGLCERTNPEVIRRFGKVRVYNLRDFLSNIVHILNLKGSLVMKEEEDLQQMDKRYVWHPFTQMQDYINEENVVIESARGSFIRDIKGRWFLDGVSSLWVNVHGHRHPYLDKALLKQINKVSHSTLLGLGNIPSILLAEKLIQIAPTGLKKVFYSDNGSCGVEIALKMAFQYWQQAGHKGLKRKKRFISFINGYHGDTLGAVSVGGIGLFHKIFNPLLFDTIKVRYPYCYRCHLNLTYPDCSIRCIDELEVALEKYSPTVAGVIIEPLVQAAGGIIVSPPGFLRKVRELCSRYEVFLIADEVAVGFGRTGSYFACIKEGVSPDILVTSKSITAGYLPLAATLTTERIYNGFLGAYSEKKTFFHGHTYTGNPLACAVALANIELFEKKGFFHSLNKKIRFFQEGLRRFKDLGCVGDVRQVGLIAGIELVKDRESKKPYPWEEKIGFKVTMHLRKYGIILRPLGNVIVLFPSLSITKPQLNYLLNSTYKAIVEVCKP